MEVAFALEDDAGQLAVDLSVKSNVALMKGKGGGVPFQFEILNGDDLAARQRPRNCW